MTLKNFLLKAWEFPQNIVGAIATRLFDVHEMVIPNDSKFDNVRIFAWNLPGGMSLGKYIFVYEPILNTEQGDEMIEHEYGHTLQSKKLGWLYLPVIGLPSLIWANCFGWYREKTGKSYYSFYTERWADKLGGVERGEE